MIDWTIVIEAVTAVAAVAAAITAVVTRNHVQKIHVEINSRMTQLLANTKELADAQGAVVQRTLIQELMTMSKNVGVEGARAAFSDQRVEIVLLNR